MGDWNLLGSNTVSEPWVLAYRRHRTTYWQRHIPENMNSQQYLSENLKSHEVNVVTPRTRCCIIHLSWIFIWDQLFYLVAVSVLKYVIHLLQDEVIFPTLVALSYLKEQNLKKKAYVLASPALKEEFESNDIMCSNDVGVSIIFLHFFLHSPCSFIV